MQLALSGDCTSADELLVPDFRAAMSRLATGVVMVTTWVDQQPWGLTISSCCSVSASPPSLLVSLGSHTTSARTAIADGAFGVSILGERLLDAARFGSAPGRPKFVSRYCGAASADERTISFSPAVTGALAHVDCLVSRVVEYADHVLLIGAVRSVSVATGDTPLLYYSRAYRVLGSASPGHAPTSTEIFYANW
jgi:flavin reductase ActVB